MHDPEARTHPGRGRLCVRCGTASEARDHSMVCGAFQRRPSLWADGWVDLNAFGLPLEAARGWPEVCDGPTAVVLEDGLGPCAIGSRSGPWVRSKDPSCATHHRVAALLVLITAGDPPARAVSKVLTGDAAAMDQWCAPSLAIDTTGCGRSHQVKIERGIAKAVNHDSAASHLPGPALRRLKTSAACGPIVDRWTKGDVGAVHLDLTAEPRDRYQRVGHNPAVVDAFRILVAATLARARSQLIDMGEPDRWLALEGRPSPLGSAAQLLESTRPIPIALVIAPPTWLWSNDPLV